MPAAASAGIDDPATIIVAIAGEVGRGATRARTHRARPYAISSPQASVAEPEHREQRIQPGLRAEPVHRSWIAGDCDQLQRAVDRKTDECDPHQVVLPDG